MAKKTKDLEKKLKAALKEDLKSKIYLTKKQLKFYRKLVKEKLESCGFSNELIPYRTGVRKFRPKLVDRPDEFVKGEDGKPVDQPAIQHTPVEMITYRNIFENMTKKVLKLPINEIEAFLALDEKEFHPPTKKEA